MIEHFADLLRAQAPRDRCRPASTEQALVGGLATMIADRLRTDSIEQLREQAPELVEFVLRAYGCCGPWAEVESLGGAQACAAARGPR